jgi:hypothetical protein
MKRKAKLKRIGFPEGENDFKFNSGDLYQIPISQNFLAELS